MGGAGAAGSIATPAGKAPGLGGLVASRALPFLASRVGIDIGRMAGRPLRLGSVVLASRYRDIAEALDRDLDFILAPVNAARFDTIGYHFILGMDRSAELARERQTLYQALAAVDFDDLRAQAQADVDARLSAAGSGSIDVVEGYARPVAAATARRLFGIAPEPQADFMDAARAIFDHCFLNLTGDAKVEARAMTAAHRLTGWFDAEIARRRKSGDLGRDMMGALLAAGANDDLTRRTLGGMLVGSIDTTATAVAKAISVLVGAPRWLALARADAGDRARTYGWVLEALRFWPHGPILIRQAATDTRLGGTEVRAGDKVILWTEAAQLDPDAFPEPFRLDPTRPFGSYLHTGQGLHPCAGRAINGWQIPMLVAGLLAKGPSRLGPMEWAGPFPAHLPLSFGSAT
ncbi:MAG: cytochrome P450 [Phenylobacterium sp.]